MNRSMRFLALFAVAFAVIASLALTQPARLSADDPKPAPGAPKSADVAKTADPAKPADAPKPDAPKAGADQKSATSPVEPSFIATPAPASYVILHAAGFGAIAKEWAIHRAPKQTTDGKTLLTEKLGVLNYADYANQSVPTAIARTAILKTFGVALDDKNKPSDEKAALVRLEKCALLILGDAPNWDGSDRPPAETEKAAIDTLIPTFTNEKLKDASPTPKPVVGDHPWCVLNDGDLEPAFAVGRIPARTEAEARAVLTKIKNYETGTAPLKADAPPPEFEWRTRLSYVAGVGGFGPVDAMLEQMFADFADNALPTWVDLNMTYANPNSAYAYPPDDLSARTASLIYRGALLVTYLGHGSYERFDSMKIPLKPETEGGKPRDMRFPIFDKAALKSLEVSAAETPKGQLPPQNPVLLVIACQTGAFDYPKGHSIGEDLIFLPGGPVAVIAGSRDTHPYTNALYQSQFTLGVTAVDRPGLTLGDIQRETKHELLAGASPFRAKIDEVAAYFMDEKARIAINKSHLWLYNLLGDPRLVPKRPDAIKGKETVKLSATELTAGPDQQLKADYPPPQGMVPCFGRVELRRIPSANRAKAVAVSYEKLLLGTETEQQAEKKNLLANHVMANVRMRGARGGGVMTEDSRTWSFGVEVSADDVPSIRMVVKTMPAPGGVWIAGRPLWVDTMVVNVNKPEEKPAKESDGKTDGDSKTGAPEKPDSGKSFGKPKTEKPQEKKSADAPAK
jgi:hypothetical protein